MDLSVPARASHSSARPPTTEKIPPNPKSASYRRYSFFLLQLLTMRQWLQTCLGLLFLLLAHSTEFWTLFLVAVPHLSVLEVALIVVVLAADALVARLLRRR
jgi:hypothetical protein